MVTQFISITDTTTPLLSIPSRLIITGLDAFDDLESSEIGQANCTDNCDSNPPIRAAFNFDDLNSTGDIEYRWKCIDQCGNIAEEVQLITGFFFVLFLTRFCSWFGISTAYKLFVSVKSDQHHVFIFTERLGSTICDAHKKNCKRNWSYFLMLIPALCSLEVLGFERRCTVWYRLAVDLRNLSTVPCRSERYFWFGCRLIPALRTVWSTSLAHTHTSCEYEAVSWKTLF